MPEGVPLEDPVHDSDTVPINPSSALAGGSPAAMAAPAALAGGSAAASRALFQYNRENFMEDREQRMCKEFAERRYRVAQAHLWRQDVRDFVSLTEKKMSIYLLVSVLLLGFTINLWCEGRLPEDAPAWLLMGMQVALVGAFAFLLLTIWLAMHVAVASQGYQTRVLTQLVRLPIPSWQELEACRTRGSDFESLEARQMFRVPLLTGAQERLAERSAERLAAEGDADEEEARGRDGAASQRAKGAAADPWGLERGGQDICELGSHYGADVAQLRHIRIIRQAAVYWQTYDAFARVSMSVGVNQLVLAMCCQMPQSSLCNQAYAL